MRKVFAKSIFTFFIIMLITIINLGCSLSVLEQSQNSVTDGKPQRSIFTVVDTIDVLKKNRFLSVTRLQSILPMSIA